MTKVLKRLNIVKAAKDYNKVMKDVEKLALKFNKDMEALMKRAGYKLGK